MDGNFVGTVYYNFGEVADWLNEPSRSGVWPKGTNHTYVDGVAMIVQAEANAPDPANPSNTVKFHPLETNYYEYTRYDRSTGVTYGWIDMSGGTDVTWSPGSCTDDCQSAALPLGFTFNFYGTDYTDVSVLANGVIVFTPLLAAEYSPFFGRGDGVDR